MIKLSLEQKRYIIRTAIIYGLLIFIFSILQTSFFARLTFLGATPNIMLILIIGTALYDGERTAAIVGITAGFFIEAQGGVGISLLPLFFFIIGYFYGIVAKQFSRDGFLLYLIHMLVGCLIGSVITLIQTALFANNYNIPLILKSIIFPEFFYTFILSLPFYFLFKLIKKHPKVKNINI